MEGFFRELATGCASAFDGIGLRRTGAFATEKKGVDITPDRAYNIHVDLKRGINSVVECHLAKVKVASSNLVSRSTKERPRSIDRGLFVFPSVL